MRVLCLVLVAYTLAGCVRLGFRAAGSSDAQAEAASPDLSVGPDLLVAADLAPDGQMPDAPSPDAEPWPAEGRWSPTSASPLSPRLWVNAAWTGKAFAAWSGALNLAYDGTTDGALYDPVTGTWSAMSVTGTPSARHTPSHVWDGASLLVYGGAQKFGVVQDGGRYDPQSDTWTALGTTPGRRIYHVALWTGSRMLLWGGWGDGIHKATGFAYDPQAATWTPMAASGAPGGRSFAGAVWTGSELLIWGGCDGAMGTCAGVKGDGARYDPVADQWKPMTASGAPAPRTAHSAVWTGSRMIVFGGCANANTAPTVSGSAAYDPVSDSWSPLSTAGAPADRCGHAAAWLPGIKRMAIWGGWDASARGDGALYDPATDSWSPVADANAPVPRQRFAFAASDRCLFIWGGGDAAGAPLDSGALWCGGPPP